MNDLTRSLESVGLSAFHAAHHVERYRRTFETMLPWLPEQGTVTRFLDIGCGYGGVAMWMARRYPGAVAHLIDGDGSEKWVGYREDGQAWSDVRLAARLFAKHCPGREVHAHPPDPAQTIPCELIWSNVSWGHHYPIETYLDLALRSLRPNGTLIVDLRLGEVGAHGEEVLARHFLRKGAAHTGKKYTRTVWRRA